MFLDNEMNMVRRIADFGQDVYMPNNADLFGNDGYLTGWQNLE